MIIIIIITIIIMKKNNNNNNKNNNNNNNNKSNEQISLGDKPLFLRLFYFSPFYVFQPSQLTNVCHFERGNVSVSYLIGGMSFN